MRKGRGNCDALGTPPAPLIPQYDVIFANLTSLSFSPSKFCGFPQKMHFRTFICIQTMNRGGLTLINEKREKAERE